MNFYTYLDIVYEKGMDIFCKHVFISSLKEENGIGGIYLVLRNCQTFPQSICIILHSIIYEISNCSTSMSTFKVVSL